MKGIYVLQSAHRELNDAAATQMKQAQLALTHCPVSHAANMLSPSVHAPFTAAAAAASPAFAFAAAICAQCITQPPLPLALLLTLSPPAAAALVAATGLVIVAVVVVGSR